MTDIIQKVRQFTEAVGCTTDRYNVRQTALYEGLCLEESAEGIEAMLSNAEGIESSHFSFLEGLAAYMRKASNLFKLGEFDEFVRTADRPALLDSSVDRVWVNIGSMLSQGADVEGAAGEVARANLSKLVPCRRPACTHGLDMQAELECTSCHGTGLVAIKDENGKVKKPEGWTPPNIEQFVCK